MTLIYDVVGDLAHVLQSREDENRRLEEEINGYRDDIDNMMETFRQRERELLNEMEYIQSKNNVIASLLDTLAERSDSSSVPSTPSTLGPKSTGTERSVSVISDVSVGSDDVFATIEKDSQGRPIIHKNWDVSRQIGSFLCKTWSCLLYL